MTAKIRPVEELYDLSVDPYETENLAESKVYSEKLNGLRALLVDWIVETGDKGLVAESEESYDSSMNAYLEEFMKRKDQERVRSIEENIAVMKKWANEGK